MWLPLDWVTRREPRTNLMRRRRRGQHKVLRAQLWVLELEPRLQPSGTLIFSDNFDQPIGSQPNPATWAPQNATDPNNPNVVYTNSTSTLSVVADPTAVGGKALAMSLMPDPNNQGKYDSSEIGTSIDPVAGQLLYGQIDASIKLPGGPNGQGDGIWPAFWMLGNNIGQVGWPTCGEMDIMENKGSTPGEIQGTIHGPGYQNTGITTKYDLPSGQAFYSSYHLFAVNWAPNLVQFSVDGNVYATLTPASLPNGGVWEFNHPFYIMLDVCDGGPFAGPPDGNSTFPQTMYVNYVQAYSYVAPPTVTAVSPAIGAAAGGTSVTITGTGFTNATQVDFGTNNPAASFVVNSDTQITAVGPSGSPGNVDITVTTAGGTSATSSSDQFTFDDSTTTSVVSSVNPSVFGQGVTFTATVSPVVGSNTPGGTVTFMDGSNTLGTATLSGGTATYTTSALAVGSQSIAAVYNGDANDAGSTSTQTESVTKDSSTTAISSSADPSVNGQTVAITAAVTANSPGSGTPAGTVTFKLNGVAQPAVKLNAQGQASFVFSPTLGTYNVIATYNGGANFTFSNSSNLQQVVNKDSTTTFLASSANPSVNGQTVTITATVSANSPGSGIPPGKVTFKVNGTAQPAVKLNAQGQATFTFSPTVGTYTVTASYSGGADFTISTSQPLSQVVNKDAALVVLVSSLNPSTFGQLIIFTATVSAATPGSGVPTGTVEFLDGTTVLGFRTLTAGQATFRTSTLSVGSHSISVKYEGDSGFNIETSDALTETVNAAGAMAALFDDLNSWRAQRAFKRLP
jgi:beta-glucanase (GH16 family)